MHELEQAQLVRDHFDHRSSTWGDLYTREVTFANYNFLIRKRHVLELFDRRGGRFLDAGCGTGDFIPDLLARGEQVVALDFSADMIQQAKARVGGLADSSHLQFAVGDVTNLQLEPNSFDAIIAVGLVEYLSDVKGALAQMYKVLKPGGILIVTVPSIASPFMAYETLVPKIKRVVKRALALFGLWKPERVFLHRHFLPWHLDWQMRQVGFRKVDFAFCTYGLMSPRFESLSLRLSAALDRYKRSPIGLLGTNYIVKVQKP
jgi:ubiquinone/menaquinone biosynthesis C-methylase UbiE